LAKNTQHLKKLTLTQRPSQCINHTYQPTRILFQNVFNLRSPTFQTFHNVKYITIPWLKPIPERDWVSLNHQNFALKTRFEQTNV